MKNIRLFLLVIIALCLLNFQKAETKVDNIEFSYRSALRGHYKEIKVYIYRVNDNKNAEAFVHCEPMSDNPIYPKVDTVFEIDIKSFEKLAKATNYLENIDLDKAYSSGLDGNRWKIEFGSMGKNINYSFWVPTWKTKERGLTEFVNLCEQILDEVKLNKKDIFEK